VLIAGNPDREQRIMSISTFGTHGTPMAYAFRCHDGARSKSGVATQRWIELLNKRAR
jgi:hypothetical protein